MGYWHELPKPDGGWIFLPPPGQRVVTCFVGRDIRKVPFAGHFMRYEGEERTRRGDVPSWHRKPEGWFELWPHEPLMASSNIEAKAMVAPLLPQIEDGSIDHLFDIRPYVPPIQPELIKQIDHPNRIAMAQIVQYPDGLYAIGYKVYAPNGHYLPASTPSINGELDFEWGVTYETDAEGNRLRTLADDLVSAEEIALIELNRFVDKNPEIRRRPEPESERS